MARFGPVVTAMVTPFDDDLGVDYDAAVALARWLADHGSTGLVLAGTTGESPTLTDDEKIELFRSVAEVLLDAARAWLADQGCSAQLVCCCAQFLPLRDEQFDLVVAGNVIEHTREPQPLMSEARRVLVGGGTFYASTCNRYSIGPEPHVRVWGVGWLPRRWMDGYVRAVRGAPYEHVRLISLLELRRLSRNAGFGKTIVDPPPVGASQRHGLPARERWMLSAYNTLRRWPGVRQMLLLVGPLLRMICVKGASDARSSAS